MLGGVELHEHRGHARVDRTRLNPIVKVADECAKLISS
jgi:hypothetical protein